MKTSHLCYLFTDLDLTQSEEESMDTLTDFVLNKIDWKKALESWNRIFVRFKLLFYNRNLKAVETNTAYIDIR